MTVVAPPEPAEDFVFDAQAAEALMREARERQRRRRRRNAAVVGAVAAVGALAALALTGGGDGRAEPTRTPVAAGLTWRPLPSAPIGGRIGEGVVWTGAEMIVWGGINRSSRAPDLADGAAYDPQARRWRTLPAAPGGMRGVVESAVWTGTEAIFWVGDWTDPARSGAAAYNPRTNTWRRIARGPLGGRQGSTTLWTGSEALVISGLTGDSFAQPVAGALDPGTGRWRLLPALNRLPGLVVGGVWSGRRAYLIGDRFLCPEQGSVCQTRRRVFLEYDPRADRLRPLGVARAPREPLAAIAWSHGRALFSRDEQIVRYSPRTQRWTAGSRRRCAEPAGQSAWAGGRYVVGCGARSVQSYDPGADAWRTVRTSRSPLSRHRFGSATAWTGRELIVWSGSLDQRGNPMTARGASLRLPR
jgi:hypothetical protein